MVGALQRFFRRRCDIELPLEPLEYVVQEYSAPESQWLTRNKRYMHADARRCVDELLARGIAARARRIRPSVLSLEDELPTALAGRSSQATPAHRRGQLSEDLGPCNGKRENGRVISAYPLREGRCTDPSPAEREARSVLVSVPTSRTGV